MNFRTLLYSFHERCWDRAGGSQLRLHSQGQLLMEMLRSRKEHRQAGWLGLEEAGKPAPEGPIQRVSCGLGSLWRRVLLTFHLYRFPHGTSGLDGREHSWTLGRLTLWHIGEFQVFSKLRPTPFTIHITSSMLFKYVFLRESLHRGTC